MSRFVFKYASISRAAVQVKSTTITYERNRKEKKNIQITLNPDSIACSSLIYAEIGPEYIQTFTPPQIFQKIPVE